MPLKREILWRVGVVYVFILLFGLLILGKIVYLQLFQGQKWEEKSRDLHLKNQIIQSNRGVIYSSNNRLLASSVPFYEIRLDTKSTGLSLDTKTYHKKLDTLSKKLAETFHDKNAGQYRKELYNARKAGERFYLVKDQVSYHQLKKLREFPLFRLGRYRGGFIV